MAVARLEDLQERRAWECRLTADRALRSLDDAHGFLMARAMLTRTADSALPSLYVACHEEPYKAGGSGFASWPRTKYPWFSQLAAREGVYQLSVHGGKSILLTAETAALADALCRAELEQRQHAGDDGARLLRHLAAVGPSVLDDLRTELEWDAAHIRRVRAPLERTGAMVSRSETIRTRDGGHTHTSLLSRWDQVFPEPAAGDGGLGDLIVAGVRAAVVAPEAEPERWFSWRPSGSDMFVDRLVSDGRLERPHPGWVTLPDP
jgi:hypothetical protein